MIGKTPIVCWFRRDLRLLDNPAFIDACQRGPVIPLFIYSPQEEEEWAPGSASKWWLHHSLESLASSLVKRGLKLIVRTGSSLDNLREIISTSRAHAVVWNRLYDPKLIARDRMVESCLRSEQVQVESFNSALLVEPWEVKNSSGGAYKVFTPYWRKISQRIQNSTIKIPPSNIAGYAKLQTLSVAELGLLPTVRWDVSIANCWDPGEDGAQKKLSQFISSSVNNYSQTRDRPACFGTSRLSPYLHFGELGPRQIWHATSSLVTERSGARRAEVDVYLRQLGWREFAHHLLFYFPETATQPLREAFSRFPWREDQLQLSLWQRGMTGYPIVDAGMRELWQTGWMHNRVRMIVASFLVKDLLIPWQRGAEWFWDTLVDADLANNTLGWQWTSGCGADAAPYFRVFNPVLQGEKFDRDGVYIKRFIPELSALPASWIHKPWMASRKILDEAKIVLGRDYPMPIVDHSQARDAALEAYARIKN